MPATKTFSAGEKILAEGTYGNETFRIHQGVVLICKETGKKKPVVLAELKTGEVFGEMYVFENPGFRSASAIAKSDVEVEVISRAEIEEQMKGTPPIIRDILISLNKRLEGTSQEFSLATVRKTQWERVINKVVMVLLALVLLVQVILMFKPC